MSRGLMSPDPNSLELDKLRAEQSKVTDSIAQK